MNRETIRRRVAGSFPPGILGTTQPSLWSQAVLGFTLVAFIALPGSALAANAETGDSQGGKADPQPGRTFRVKLNPDVTISVGIGDTLESFLLRLVEAINAASQGEYMATHSPGSTSFQILRSNGEELDNLRLVENDGAIQNIQLTVARPGLQAIIGSMQEDPSGGELFVTLNGRTVSVDTTGLGTASAVTLVLFQEILDAGFLAEFQSSFIVVQKDLTTGGGLTQVGLRSTDPAIVTSDLELAPPPAKIPALGPSETFLLVVFLALVGLLLLRRREVEEKSSTRNLPPGGRERD